SEPIGARTVALDPRSLDVKVWFGDGSSSLLRSAVQVAYPTVNRRLKGNRLPQESAPASSGTETLPPLQPVNTPPSANPTAPPHPPSSGPRPKSVERLDHSLAPVDAFGDLPTDISISESDDVTASLPPAAQSAPERGGAREVAAEADEDAFLADKPPE